MSTIEAVLSTTPGNGKERLEEREERGILIYPNATEKLVSNILHPTVSKESAKITLLWMCFLGIVGGHQFYLGKPMKGLMMMSMCVLGAFVCSPSSSGMTVTFPWVAYNMIELSTGSLKDGQGKYVVPTIKDFIGSKDPL